MSYAQSGEDQIVLDICGYGGRFLDIGSFHPTHLSNTRLLYEHGWTGVMIEPVSSVTVRESQDRQTKSSLRPS